MNALERIVITGVGLTSPIGDNLSDYRKNILEGKSGISYVDIRHMGPVPTGLCHFDETKYQKKKDRRRGTRAGSIGIYCAHEAINDSKVDFENLPKDRIGVYIGITEHGNVETENEVHLLHENDKNISLWSHHHNPRTVANNPAGEVCLNLKIHGPHYTLGAACAAGNIGVIQGAQMLRLNEVDFALVGGVSECPATFGIFAAFKSQGALGQHEDPAYSCRPLDKNRNGIAVSEGGVIFTLERLSDAIKRNAKIYGEVAGYAINTDATDFVLPNAERQEQCMRKALAMAKMEPSDIHIVSMHATGTVSGDEVEIESIKNVFGNSPNTKVNGTKALIGHAMGASGALELVGNIPSFEDDLVHPFFNIDELDPKCELANLVINRPVTHKVNTILNNSFGMLGINSALIIKKFEN